MPGAISASCRAVAASKMLLTYDCGVATLTDMESWTDRLGHTRLRSLTDKDGNFWLEQNPAKRSKWAKLAREGHAIAWQMANAGGSYTGRMLIDGEVYDTHDAASKFLKGTGPEV